MTEANYGCQMESFFSLYQKIIICLKIENSHKKDSSMPVLAHTPQVNIAISCASDRISNF